MDKSVLPQNFTAFLKHVLEPNRILFAVYRSYSLAGVTLYLYVHVVVYKINFSQSNLYVDNRKILVH